MEKLLDARVLLRVAERESGRRLDAWAVAGIENVLRQNRVEYAAAIRNREQDERRVDRQAVLACFTEELRMEKLRNGSSVDKDRFDDGQHTKVSMVAAQFTAEAAMYLRAWKRALVRIRRIQQESATLYRNENDLRAFLLECLQGDEDAYALALYRAADIGKEIFKVAQPIFVRLIDELMLVQDDTMQQVLARAGS